MYKKDERPSLRRAITRGASFEILGYASTQLLRLASNLILARLLFPEAFGLAALVSVFTHGLVMLSDIGIRQAIIQNERGNEVDFLNTAWAIQVGRGFGLWLFAGVLAWPMSIFYAAPELIWLIPVGSISVIFSGLSSTSLFTLRRRLHVGTINLIEVSSQFVGVIVMVVWAIYSPSVWALVAGGLTISFCSMVASHLVPVGYRNRLSWEKQSALDILRFGKWIFGSSAVTYFGQQGDRLLIGYFVGMPILGVYSIALMLSEVLGAAVNRVITGVVYGVFSKIQQHGLGRLKVIYYKVRLRLDIIVIPSLGALTILGSHVIGALYDDRYSEAGWILELLCIRVAMSCVLNACEACLTSIGQTKWGFYRSVGRSSWIIIGILIVYPIAGLQGLVWIVTLSEIPALFILWVPFYRQDFLRIGREALTLILFVAGMGFGLLLESFLLSPDSD